MSIYKYLIILPIILLSACATSTTGQDFQQSNLPKIKNQTAQLIIYRQTQFSAPRSPMIKVNGVDTCDLPGGTYIVVDTPAQEKTTVYADLWDIPGHSTRSFKTKPNQRYFVRLRFPTLNANPGVLFGAIGGAIGGAIEGLTDENADQSGPFIIETMTEDMALHQLASTKESKSCVKAE